MTKQTASSMRLGGSPSEIGFSRFCTLTLAAILFTGGAAAGFAQAQPDAAKPAKQVKAAKPASEPETKMVGGYMVHQSLEVGGRYTTTGGSQAMWDTLVNQGSGGRILGQSLEMHSADPSRTRFFDTLSTSSTGYGGDPYDVTRLKASKGKLWDFTGSFRRDRQYFDYNLLDNSLLGANALVPEPDSLHLFNTARRNTDVNLTVLPLSLVSFRAGFNHGTHQGPSFTTVHDGGDVQLAQFFRNGSDTYSGGVDLKVARRTTVSYDQFYVLYKGDTTFSLAGAAWKLSDGTPVSLGVDTLKTATCGSGANKTIEVINGVANPYCSGTTAMTMVSPTRTTFPTEQLRFSSHYWDKVAFNGRMLYSGATGAVNKFDETFTGFSSRTFLRQEVETGGYANGQMALHKRVNVNGDLGFVAEIRKVFSVSDALDYWDFRSWGKTNNQEIEYVGTSAASMLTPLSSLTPTTSGSTASGFLNQKITANTVILTANLMPEFKLSGGYRYKIRQIDDPHATRLTWHENTLLLGAVMQPNPMVRLNLNFDAMNSVYASGGAILAEPATPVVLLPGNTFTRVAPNRSYNVRLRATVKPAKWINFSLAGKAFEGENDDPLINHLEHNRDASFTTTIMPMDGLSFDFNYAYDDVYSKTNLCYLSTAPATGAANGGSCVTTVPEGAANLLLGTGLYSAPTHFYSGAIHYSPTKLFHFSAGGRMNDINGTAEQLSPLMVPGALKSRYVTPFADAEYNLTSQWAWHGNFTRTQYTEQGPVGSTASRNTGGDVLTLGVKYEY